MTQAALAERIARLAHDGQMDHVDPTVPYIRHVERVVGRVVGNDGAMAVAWLHDVLEDTPWTAPDLLSYGIRPDVVRAAELLSRVTHSPYQPYLDALAESGDLLAVTVKIADLQDHLATQTPPSLLPRYEKALARLVPIYIDLVTKGGAA